MIWIMDFIVILIIAIPAIMGYRKGFIYACIGFLPVLVSFFGAKMISPVCSKFLRKTIRPEILSKLQTNFEKNDSKRVFFGKLENCHFTLYSVPDISGPWNSKIWLSPWRGMAMWVSPVHIYGTVYGTLEETKIDFTIAKRKRDIFIYNFVIITDMILFIIKIISILKYGFSIYSWNDLLGVIGENIINLLMFSMMIAGKYIPNSEKEALLKFLDDLEA